MGKKKTNVVFEHLSTSNKKYVIEQGGTRSGKSYNILIWIIYYCGKHTGKTVSICRKSFPALRGSVYRDFIEILMEMDLYTEQNHNKTENIYRLHGNLIEFIAVDQPQKIRGRKRHICFINEANEITKEDFFQLDIRTEEKVIIDYNPSDEFWVDQLRQETDCDFHITTYKNNPFLAKELVEKIERLKYTDENLWKIYGLGIRGIVEGQIFPVFELMNHFPVDAKKVAYGLDFGYTNDPTAIVRCGLWGGKFCIEEIIYETNLTNQAIYDRLVDRRILGDFVCDSAEPKSIRELNILGGRSGLHFKQVKKGADSIKNGIDIMKRYPIVICGASPNVLKEFRRYVWKKDKSNDVYLNVPIDFMNHAIDAIRYYAMTYLGSSGRANYKHLLR